MPDRCVESTPKKLAPDMVLDLTTQQTISEVTEEEEIKMTSTPSSFIRKASYSPEPRKEVDSEYFIRPSPKVPFGRKKPVLKPNSIPGEGERKVALVFQTLLTFMFTFLGICRFAGKIYQNGEKVEKDDPCLDLCLCINSLIFCDHVVCDPRPEEKIGTKCEPIRILNRCCPEYKCCK